MWSTSNDYGLSNIGVRTLGDYTEQQRQIALAYKLALTLAGQNPNNEVFAQIDLPNREIQIGEGDAVAALAYGLKPYIVPQKYQATSLVNQNAILQNPTLLGNHIQPNMLRGILRQIVEDV